MNQLTAPDDLTSYLNYVNAAPMLSREDEQRYAKQVYHNNDASAAQKLIVPHLRLVVSIARKQLGYGLPIHDLIQEGNIGLIKAVERFDYTKGVRLSVFSLIYIKNNIYKYILDNWKPIKIATTKVLQKAFFNIRGLRKNHGVCTEQERNSIAKTLNISVADVHTMEGRLNDRFLSGTVNSDGEHVSFEETLPSSDLRPDEVLMEQQDKEFIKSKIMTVLDDISDRDRDIIMSRKFVEKAVKLSSLSKKYGISMERVRQLEARTIKKLENVVKNY